MKKLIYSFAVSAVMSLLLITAAGCTADTADTPNTNENIAGDTPYILCAGFSEYDWTRNILGDNPGGIRLELLNQSGSDMHSYQPSVSDMVKLTDCDLLIYTGGLSEFWIDKAASSSKASHDSSAADTAESKRILSLMEFFEENPELFSEYAQDAHEHEHEHEYEEHEHEEGEVEVYEHEEHEHSHEGHEHELDEHLWLSLRNAQLFCGAIANAVSELDPDNSEYYSANLKAYTDKLSALDESYMRTVSTGTSEVLIFADRFPFTYMLQDYGLHCHAAFDGCSAETEASFETVIELAGELNSDALDHIVVLKNSPSGEKLARTIIAAAERSNVEISALDSLQSVTAKELSEGYTYINAMEKNLEVLSECLN